MKEAENSKREREREKVYAGASVDRFIFLWTSERRPFIRFRFLSKLFHVPASENRLDQVHRPTGNSITPANLPKRDHSQSISVILLIVRECLPRGGTSLTASDRVIGGMEVFDFERWFVEVPERG